MQLSTTERKAVRLARDGRVTITSIDTTDDRLVLVAEVIGDSGTYTVTIDPAGRTCTCPHGMNISPAARCSHVFATIIVYEYTKEVTAT